MTKTRLMIATTLLLAACDAGQKDQGSVDNATIADNGVMVDPAKPAPPTPKPAPSEPPANSEPTVDPAKHVIPAAFQGRWGMVPKDCGPDAAIAKGLMTVDGGKLRFYESVGKPAVVTYPTPMRMEGRFSFSGEGMDWSKDMVLSVKGDTLTRTEKDPAASYTYTRCPA
ncbi:MAG TPA: hypothetical protein VF475_18165 [Sphingobium sp.]